MNSVDLWRFPAHRADSAEVGAWGKGLSRRPRGAAKPQPASREGPGCGETESDVRLSGGPASRRQLRAPSRRCWGDVRFRCSTQDPAHFLMASGSFWTPWSERTTVSDSTPFEVGAAVGDDAVGRALRAARPERADDRVEGRRPAPGFIASRASRIGRVWARASRCSSGSGGTGAGRRRRGCP